MAISTMGTFLMRKSTDGVWRSLTDIKDFPDMGGTPEGLDATTLSEDEQSQIDGVKSSDSLSFTCNYDSDKYAELKEIERIESEYALWVGGERSGNTITPTGTNGIYEFNGKLFVYLAGGDVNAVTEMVVVIVPTTGIYLVEYGTIYAVSVEDETYVLGVSDTETIVLATNDNRVVIG